MPLLGEMRRRNIFKVSLAYAILSWLLVQVAGIVLPALDAPQWIMQVLVVGLILMFPVTALLAWAYELTPEGFKSTADVDKTQSITVQTGRKLNHIVAVLLCLVLIFHVVEYYVLKPVAEREPDFAYRQSIAAIPFVNQSAPEDDAGLLADGLHAELLARLAKVPQLRVIARTSVLGYRDTTRSIRQIGEELGVGSILEGRLQRTGDALRIDIQLIDARTDEHIWADTFDRELNAANLFAIQTELATAIADALEASLTPAEEARLALVPTDDLQALEAYFAGVRSLETRNERSLLESIEHFEQAVSLDPRFAVAWAGIAEAWFALPDHAADLDHRLVRRRSSSAATRAIMLDPESPEALAAVGWHLLLYSYDWAGAESALRSALQIAPSNVNALRRYSHLLAWQGKQDDAIAAAELAVTLDPLSPAAVINLTHILMDAQRWDAARATAAPLLRRGPYASLLGDLWVGSLKARQAEVAAAQLLAWAEATGRDLDAAKSMGDLLVESQAREDSVDLPNDLLDRLRLAGTGIAEIYAAIGDAENTIRALQETERTGAGICSLLSMKINPSYDFIRDDPRFSALLEDVGLTD